MTRNSIFIAIWFLGAGFALDAGADVGQKRLATSQAKPAAPAGAAWTEGEVARVDKAAGRVTIKHGALPKLDMPPMTMPYPVNDKTVLEHLKSGDKIRFDVESVGGVFTVIRLEKSK
ncbi:MAG: hypothetical protein A3H32_04765 [Betaproteobacteria bacterium RIFCSPLOWO2_02_FULL_63_19]|nr:MAG: hypothetical protein A3H32_04765 [Betaproteobacteria bacterium RIFCSPLOWO2_02_FULL_63_19]